MAVGNAEVMLVPEVSEPDLMRTLNRMEHHIDRMADRAGKDLERNVRDGIEDGAKKGSREAGLTFSRMFAGIKNQGRNAILGATGSQSMGGALGTGAKMLGGSIVGLAMLGIFEAVGRVQESSGYIDSLLGEGGLSARRAEAARDTGMITRQQFSQQSAMYAIRGGIDPEEYQDALTAFAGTMAQDTEGVWKNYRSMGAGYGLIDLLATYSTGGHRKDELIDVLKQAGIDDVNASKFATVAWNAEGATAAERRQSLSTMNMSEGEKLANVITMQLDKGDKYREEMFKQQLDTMETQLSRIGDSTIESRRAWQQYEDDRNTKLLEQYDESTKTAMAAMTAYNAAMDTLVGSTNNLTESINNLVAAITAADNPNDAIRIGLGGAKANQNRRGGVSVPTTEASNANRDAQKQAAHRGRRRGAQ